jgi:SAM-dependent methyltransferase
MSANRSPRQLLTKNDATSWFEPLYANANWNEKAVPWANLTASPDLVEWLNHHQIKGHGQKALVVGCGLGDDAEELARRGFEVVAFDISSTAIEWCKKRFPNSTVDYRVVDLFNPPTAWLGAFDFVLEYYTVQALPPHLNKQTIEAVARLVAEKGTLLVICLGRDAEVQVDGPPWPLSKDTLNSFREAGLIEVEFEEYGHSPNSSVRRFRVQYSCCNENME